MNIKGSLIKIQATIRATLARANEKEWPSEYVCKFLEPGLVSYEDVKAGINLLRKEAILKMLPSFKGKPVIENHREISPENMKKHAVGYIIDAWWDDASGWAWAKMMITDDSAKDLIRKGYSISCAFKVLEPLGTGGEWHAIKYNEEILDGEFEHMAIVINPRYEDAEILGSLQNSRVLVNSKVAELTTGKSELKVGMPISFNGQDGVIAALDGEDVKIKWNSGKETVFKGASLPGKSTNKENKPMFSLLNKKQKNKTEIDPSKSMLEVDGKKVSLADLMAAHNAKDKPKKNSKEVMAEVEEISLEDSIIGEDGQEVSIGDLVESFRLTNDKGGESEADKKNAKDEEEKKENKRKEMAKRCSCSKKGMENAKEEEHDKDCDSKKNEKKGEEPETTTDDETTIKKNGKEGRDNKHFRLINSAREHATTAIAGSMVEMSSDKRARGEKLFG